MASYTSSLAIDGSNSEFTEVSLRGLDLDNSDFSGVVFDSALSQRCRLSGARFRDALLFECDMIDATVSQADFTGLDPDFSLILAPPGRSLLKISGPMAIRYLAFHGALTDPIDDYQKWQHHPKFSIVMKICEHVLNQRNSQLSGLTRRGEARDDPPFARAFVQHLRQAGLIDIGRHNLVSATAEGRRLLPELVEHCRLPEVLSAFLKA